MLLEICTTSVEDCRMAQTAGADRIELNCALEFGGLTPSPGCLIEAKRQTWLPIIVMIRPRPGGFCYSDGEFKTMLRDIDFMLEHGGEGIVFGITQVDGQVDVARCREVLERANGYEVVFHRAFDLVPDPQRTLEQLIDLGIKRVMTSGQKPTALQGASLIADLREQASGRIEILPAGGITAHTVGSILERTGCRQVHASLSMMRLDPSVKAESNVRFNSQMPPPEDRLKVTDGEAVRMMRRVLDNWPT